MNKPHRCAQGAKGFAVPHPQPRHPQGQTGLPAAPRGVENQLGTFNPVKVMSEQGKADFGQDVISGSHDPGHGYNRWL